MHRASQTAVISNMSDSGRSGQWRENHACFKVVFIALRESGNAMLVDNTGGVIRQLRAAGSLGWDGGILGLQRQVQRPEETARLGEGFIIFR